MGGKIIRWAIVIIVILMLFQAVDAENPKLIWNKHLTGEQKRGDERVTVDCPISSISLSQDGKLVGYQKDNNPINTACYSPYFLLKGSNEIELESSSIIKGFAGEDDKIVALGVAIGPRKNVYFYSSTGEKIFEFKTKDIFSLTHFEVSANGKYIIFIDGHKSVLIYNEEGELISSFNYDGQGSISSASVSNKGEIAIITSDEYSGGRVILYGVSGNQIFNKELEFKNGIVKISFDGKRVALAVKDFVNSFSGLIFLDNYGDELWRYNTWESGIFEGEVSDIEMGFDGNYLVVFLHDNWVEILDEQGEQIGNYSTSSTGELMAQKLSISEKGDYILVSSFGGNLHYLDNTANIKPTIVVLANSIDFELNSELMVFLDNKGVTVLHATSETFDQYQDKKNIVILGGPDSPEGVGEIVKEVLMNSEQNQIRKKGSSMIFSKTNVWVQSQSVTVIAGSDRKDTQNSANENKAKITTESK
ncbi:hypothetical protein BMS3Abin16_01182 [archaeon BMS3Abin16]|nr:hypothetical protein BMS3Abin16_01182 [archaeon BMS3Abin16]